MAVGNSAVLPEAGGAHSAAPTVQSGGKPMEVRKDCPPDSKASQLDVTANAYSITMRGAGRLAAPVVIAVQTSRAISI